jgi:hypothetical protein
MMSNERILAYNMSKQLTIDELKEVSAAGSTCYGSAAGSYDPGRGGELHVDVDVDL